MDQLFIVGVGGYLVVKYVVSPIKLLLYLKKWILMMLKQLQVESKNAATGRGYIHVNQKFR